MEQILECAGRPSPAFADTRDGTAYVISGLKEQRSAMAGRIVDLRRELDRLQAGLVHLDAVLRMYGEEPARSCPMSVLSVHFGRDEIARRCRDLLREQGSIRADEVAVRAMRDKGLDAGTERKIRTDFCRRILVALHDMLKAGEVEKTGYGRGVRWSVVVQDEAGD